LVVPWSNRNLVANVKRLFLSKKLLANSFVIKFGIDLPTSRDGQYRVQTKAVPALAQPMKSVALNPVECHAIRHGGKLLLEANEADSRDVDGHETLDGYA